jgi:hypothetical protein
VEDKLFYSLSHKGPIDNPKSTRIKKDSKKIHLSQFNPHPLSRGNSDPAPGVKGAKGQKGNLGSRTPQDLLSQTSSRFIDPIEFSQSGLSIPKIGVPSVNILKKK